MENSALIAKEGCHESGIRRRVELIVSLDEEFNILMAMDVLPIAQLHELKQKAIDAGIFSVAKRICKELGEPIDFMTE